MTQNDSNTHLAESEEKMDSKFERVKTSEEEDPNDSVEIWRIWKNVLIIGFAFMVHFTAFWGASNLQSSINAEAALGTFTLASIYGSLLLSNIFLPAIIIRWFGCKWTIAISFITYMPFIIAQFYPRFYTMIPAGLAVGLGGGPLWCAKCTYLTIVAEAFARITKTKSDVNVTRFFGIFFMFYQFSQVWGNLISSTVLSSGSTTDFNVTNVTSFIELTTITPSKDLIGICGANFCPLTISANDNTTTTPTLHPPAMSKIHLIAGIYLGCMILACVIIAVGVDSLDRYAKDRKQNASTLSGFKLLSVTVRHLGNPLQILILPITMFIGAEQAFIAADFNAAFVSCGWGISNIGFVMICFGVCNGLAAIFIGSIIKITGRIPIVCLAFMLHVALIVTLLIWEPSNANKVGFFAISALWGVCDAVWLVQINSFSGILFPGQEEAAYSNFRLWESTGSVITYAYSSSLCASTKLYLLLGLLLIGVCGYATVEYKEYKKRNTPTSRSINLAQIDDNSKSGEVAD